MKVGRIFLIAVMAGALGALGCGDDGGGGTAGSGGSGTAGTGGSGTAGTGGGNGAPVSTCDAVCGDSPVAMRTSLTAKTTARRSSRATLPTTAAA